MIIVMMMIIIIIVIIIVLSYHSFIVVIYCLSHIDLYPAADTIYNKTKITVGRFLTIGLHRRWSLIIISIIFYVISF